MNTFITRKDIQWKGRDFDIDSIDRNNVRDLDLINKSNFVVFIDDDYNYKILKNRFDEEPIEEIINEIRYMKLSKILGSF